MAKRDKLSDDAIAMFLNGHPGWENKGTSLSRAYAFRDFSAALGFVVRLGLLAEKHDHHPDVVLGWGKARVDWSTHDAGGITAMDTELAALTDALYV